MSDGGISTLNERLRIYQHAHIMRAAENVCRIISVLQGGRRTTTMIAEHANISERTVRRYMPVISLYFNIHEELIDRSVYYWIEPVARGGGRYGTERFCRKCGHDKHAPHGGYWMRDSKTEKLVLICAVCRRNSNNLWYERKGRGLRVKRHVVST